MSCTCNLSQCDELVVLMVTAPDGPMGNKWLRMEGRLGLDHYVQRIKRAEHFLVIKDVFNVFFIYVDSKSSHSSNQVVLHTSSCYTLLAATR